MNLQTEVYISIDNENYSKIDLFKNESISMRYVLKDTTDLSKIFSPYSLSFTFPGTLNNQRIFGFVGNVKVFKVKTDNIFSCKIYSNGLLAQTGKLKLTEVKEDKGRIKSFTANFTTTMLSLQDRMGEDLINDLPDNSVKISWLPNDVYASVSSVKIANTQPSTGIDTKYYVPLISRNRIFQVRTNTSGNYLDNVKYFAGANPVSTKVIKPSELRPAVQFRTVIDLIRKKYNLDVEMPLDLEAHYNDLYIYCNAESTAPDSAPTVDLINDFVLTIEDTNNDAGGEGLPPSPRYVTTMNTVSDTITVVQDNSFNPTRWGGDFQLYVKLNNILILDDSTTGDFLITVKRIIGVDEDILFSEIASKDGTTLLQEISITDSMFVSGSLTFKIEVTPQQISSWTTMDISTIQEYYHTYVHLGFDSVERIKWKYASTGNNNSLSSGGGVIDLFKSLPKVKCSDFLNSFFKTFNISVFDASPNDDKLFWLTPKDLLVSNKAYSKKVVDYTPYQISESVTKTLAADFNYYNFKHATSKYFSNVNYKTTNGVEFGQTTYPTVKPTIQLNEFKVETGFSILPAVPITGLTTEVTSYGFNSDAPELLVTGEKRYKSNSEELTIFFACGIKTLMPQRLTIPPLPDRTIGFQGTNEFNNLVAKPLNSYIKTSPVHPTGFSLGFSLIQEATIRSLYFDFYKTQTERLLNPNTLAHSFELNLPASELVLNYASTEVGMSQVPDGFRLQNEIVLQELRFSVIDAQIDITTGKAKMNLLNF